ncbi:sodium/mannose cotransporter SLC5A10-like [Tubulanus polymorphus]|uniref:sodium/mannose cotransporter SLC5A10-like n=1 Tax=Tubulanus polymorphus TaxID=672921 RepID=UPI003DA60DFF
MAGSSLAAGDIVAICLYFAAVIAAGIYSLCRSNRGTVSGYFLAGRFMTWLPVGASLFASNIGSEHFIGLAGSGAASGIGVGAFEFNACILVQMMGWLFLPVFIASGVHTLPEYMKKRFHGNRIRIYLACLSILLYVFTKISVNLYSGALFIQQSLGWNLYLSILLLLVLTALCTVTGGLAAVIYTDTLQAFVMVAGASVLAVMSFLKVGGYQGLREQYPLAIANETLYSNSTCGLPSEKAFTMLRGLTDPDMPWLGFLLGQTPASIWYWSTDQMMVQRALAAKSLSHAQGGCLLCGYLKMLPLFIIIMPGMISRVLYPNEVACSDPQTCYEVCQSTSGCSNIAYPKLVLGIMPQGLRGIMMAVMLAALMSDLTSIFNSASTLITMDIYRHIRKKAKNRELMIVGRLFVLVMVGISIVWIPVIQEFQGGQLFIYIQVISAHLAPPIAAVYLLAILWKRATEKGVFWGLMIGLVIGLTRMVLEFVYKEPLCGEPDTRPLILSQVHYMYFALGLFWVVGATMVVISLLTAPTPNDRLIRTTFWTRYDKGVHPDDRLLADYTGVNADKVGDTSENEPPQSSQHHLIEKIEMDKINLEDKETIANEIETEDVEIRERSLRGYCVRGFNWFCGFESDPEKAAEFEAHLKGLTALKQDPRAKKALVTMLVFISILTAFLYGFFSAGS